jgi:8-oxo-dGTP pyrophosphatase MutT (NUDIX family)
VKIPYRQRVELLIWHKGKVLITTNESEKGVWYGIPGSGIHPRELPYQAANRTALEELGFQVKNIHFTGRAGITQNYYSRIRHRMIVYTGAKTRLYKADFDSIDESILSKDSGITGYEWKMPQDARDILRKHIKNGGGSGTHAIDYLKNIY